MPKALGSIPNTTKTKQNKNNQHVSSQDPQLDINCRNMLMPVLKGHLWGSKLRARGSKGKRQDCPLSDTTWTVKCSSPDPGPNYMQKAEHMYTEEAATAVCLPFGL